MSLRLFFSNSVWNIYPYLGDGLPGRRSFETETQTEVVTANAETHMEYFPKEIETQTEVATRHVATQIFVKWGPSVSEAQTQTDPKIFARVRADNLESLEGGKVKRVTQNLLTVSRVTCRLQTAEAHEQSQKLAKLKSLIGPLKEEVRQMPLCSLKRVAQPVINHALEAIGKIECGREGPFAELEKRIEKLEDFCHLDKNYGQKEFLWIATMVTPDLLKTEDQCVEEWRCKLVAIYNHQAELRRQYLEADTELESIVKFGIENKELELRVCLLFLRLSQSFVKMEQDTKALEEAMDAFGKKYPKFQETKEEISLKKHKNGIEKNQHSTNG